MATSATTIWKALNPHFFQTTHRQFAPAHLLNFGNEIRRLKLAVDAGEADVGDLVELEQLIHDDLSQFDTGNFVDLFEFCDDFLFDFGDQGLELFGGHRTLPTSPLETVANLIGLKKLARSIPLDDLDIDFGDSSWVLTPSQFKQWRRRRSDPL
jgi:hypothetical protein